jgi:hypothetical protein
MDDLDKIKSQIDNGQGLTCAQARILWGSYAEASRYAAYALGPYKPTLNDWRAFQNSYSSPQPHLTSNTLGILGLDEDNE